VHGETSPSPGTVIAPNTSGFFGVLSETPVKRFIISQRLTCDGTPARFFIDDFRVNERAPQQDDDSPVTTPCPRLDLNGDCHIDFLDLSILAQSWLTSDCYKTNWCRPLNLDYDYEVDLVDLMLLTEQWLVGSGGTEFWIESPLFDERFVKSETVEFKAITSDGSIADNNGFQWFSDIDGFLGDGLVLNKSDLSLGNHTIEIIGHGLKASVPIRVYDDLWELYQSPPSHEEIGRIMGDFYIDLEDDCTKEDEKWGLYEPIFYQSLIDPSVLVTVAKLDILRHQRFSEPVPFTNGKTVYEHLKTYVNTITLRLDCGYNLGGGAGVSLNRNFSVWDARVSGTLDNPDACKTPFANVRLYKYISPLYLLMHECRHCERTDPLHTYCDGIQADPFFENGGGHAQAALYLMWVYKYGLYDPPFIKQEARSIAKGILESRFCAPPTHSNPLVQAIINELYGPPPR